jgi:lipopolysaccharide transport system permease protein
MILNLLRALWSYRYFLVTSIMADFRNRVLRSRLGFLWIILAPLSQVLIYAFVLSNLMSQRLPGIDSSFSYAIYLMSGFQAWLLFSEIITRSITVFIDNGNVLKKISFPRTILPIVVISTSLITNLIFLALVIITFTLVGFPLGWNLLWLPVMMIINTAFAAGIGLVAGILNVFIRDIGQLTPILMQFLFWFTPIVYTINILPEAFQKIVMLNPMFWIIDGYHRVMVFNEAPLNGPLMVIFGLSLVILGLAFWLFRKASPEMVDAL